VIRPPAPESPQTSLTPMRMQSSATSRLVHKVLAEHADTPAVRALRQVAERIVEYLHSENHDPRTNGEFNIVRRLGDFIAVAVDAGANHGIWTAEVLRRSASARVFCYEIATPTRKILAANVKPLRRAEVINAGLASYSGHTSITYYPADDQWTSRFRYPHRGETATRTEYVVRGDDEMRRLQIDHIDLLKVDAEGSDYDILLGFKQALETRAIRVIQFEYGYVCVLAKVFLLDFYELLQPCGYRIGRLSPRGVRFQPYRFEDEDFFGPNFVAVQADDNELLSLLRGKNRRDHCTRRT
jgi:FkbM family methyltransferase